MMAGFIAHTILIGVEFFSLGHLPVENFHQTLSFAAWSFAGVYLFLKFKYRLNILGVYASLLVTVFMIAALCVPAVEVEPTALFKSLWLIIHVVIIFIAEASLAAIRAMPFGTLTTIDISRSAPGSRSPFPSSGRGPARARLRLPFAYFKSRIILY